MVRGYFFGVKVVYAKFIYWKKLRIISTKL